jgi:hypothetical protein
MGQVISTFYTSTLFSIEDTGEFVKQLMLDPEQASLRGKSEEIHVENSPDESTIEETIANTSSLTFGSTLPTAPFEVGVFCGAQTTGTLNLSFHPEFGEAILTLSRPNIIVPPTEFPNFRYFSRLKDLFPEGQPLVLEPENLEIYQHERKATLVASVVLSIIAGEKHEDER